MTIYSLFQMKEMKILENDNIFIFWMKILENDNIFTF